jgi:hypothetical protein
MRQISEFTTQNLSFGFSNRVQFFQHIDAMMNITETTDPNVERETFNRGLKILLVARRSTGRRK